MHKIRSALRYVVFVVVIIFPLRIDCFVSILKWALYESPYCNVLKGGDRLKTVFFFFLGQAHGIPREAQPR